MAAIALTPGELAETIAIAEVADPPRCLKGRTVGAPRDVARVEALIPDTWTRDGNAPPPGVAMGITCQYVAWEIEATPEGVYRLLDRPGAECSVATRGVLLAGVGERGPNREFGLEYRFDEFGNGR